MISGPLVYPRPRPSASRARGSSGPGEQCRACRGGGQRPLCTGETRPDDPVAFIAEAFAAGHIPDGAEGGPRTELSLSAYLAAHQVVAIVQQAVGACAAEPPAAAEKQRQKPAAAQKRRRCSR